MEPNLRALVRSGDPDAFGVLFDEHARAVYSYAYGVLGGWPAAEEAVSLTFLEAWRLRETLRPDGGPLRPWLLGIAVNVSRNLARSARRHRAAMSRLPPAPDLPDFADDLVTQMDDAARLATVRRAFTRLRAREREVLMLCGWSGLSNAQAAGALGVPEGTVRSRLSRARRSLQALVDDMESTPGGAARFGPGRVEHGRGRGQGQGKSSSGDGLARETT